MRAMDEAMANQKPIDPEEEPSQATPDGNANPNAKRTPLQILDDYIHKFISATAGPFSSLGSTARLALTLAVGLLAAVVLLWIFDKVVFYFLARSYVDQVSRVFDLNEHLANALVLLTFIAVLFFGRYIWSFSKQKRMIGIAGIAALLIGHSLVLWYGTTDVIIGKCYVLSRDGNVTYREHPGVDPATGRQCRPVTPEMVERLRNYAAGKRAQRITDSNPAFFDPRSGEPIVWYYKPADNNIEIFDLMGFHPDTGEELIPITREIAEQWKKQVGEIARRVPKLIVEPDKFTFFDPRNGQARAWYWLGANGRYEFYDSPGFQPQTGDKLQLVTREVVDDWKDKQKNPTLALRAPAKVQIAVDTVFFDPVTGNTRLWYWRPEKADYEFFDGPGFHPGNGQPLQSFTKDDLTQYQQEVSEKAKELKAEQDRIEADQKAKKEANDRKQLEEQKKTEAEQRKRAEEAQRLSEAARRCDELAANPDDAHKVGNGVSYADLKPQAATAVEACELAARQGPNELRFQYQLGRALELTGDGAARTKNRQRALQIHQALVNAGYAAAFDNLASLYRWDRKDLATAISIFRRGIELGDSDSMISLADLVESNQVIPQTPSETPLKLYKRAAELGNQNAIRAYQDELAKAQQMQQQEVQQIQQKRIMLQFMGTVLQNIH